MEQSKYLTLVLFTGGSRLLSKTFFGNKLLMNYNYRRRVKLIFPTAVIHSVYHFELTFFSKKEYKSIPVQQYKVIREDL